MEILSFPVPRRLLLSLAPALPLLPLAAADARGLFRMPPSRLVNR